MRLPPLSLVIAVVVCGLALPAAGQQNPTTIQLPTFSFFGVSTTVMVPDRGGAYLGGVNRSATGGGWSGPPLRPGISALGSDTSASSVWLTARIHDFRAMERAMERAAPAPINSPRRSDFANRLAREAAPDAAGRKSVSALREVQARAEAQRDREIERYLQRARAALADGNRGVARVWYSMGWRRADAAGRRAIEAEMNALSHRRAAERKSATAR